MQRAICPKCRTEKRISRHHYLPKRFWRRSPTIGLCRSCHSLLETFIPRYRKMPKRFYFWIVKTFLEGGEGNAVYKVQIRQFFESGLCLGGILFYSNVPMHFLWKLF